MMSTETQQFLTVDEVAERLNIGTRHAYRLVQDGTLPSLRLRRLIRIPAEGLERLISEGGTLTVGGPR